MTIKTTRTTKAATITRSLDFGQSEGGALAIVTELHERKKSHHVESKAYLLRRIPTDFGVGIEVAKQDETAEVYHVHLDKTLGDSCTCSAGVYRSACRHLDMCREAVNRKLI